MDRFLAMPSDRRAIAFAAAMFVDEPPPFEDLLRVVERFQDDFNRG